MRKNGMSLTAPQKLALEKLADGEWLDIHWLGKAPSRRVWKTVRALQNRGLIEVRFEGRNSAYLARRTAIKAAT